VSWIRHRNGTLQVWSIFQLDFCLAQTSRQWVDELGPVIIPKEREAMLNSFVAGVKKFIVSEDGPTAVEYAVMLSLIVIVCIAAVQAIGTNSSATFLKASQQVGT
jgi:pilus assembly protein Flp/PilA